MKKSILITILIFSINGYGNIKNYRNDSDKIILNYLEITKKNWDNEIPIKFCDMVNINSNFNPISIKKCNKKLETIDSIRFLNIKHKRLKSILEINKSKNINYLGIEYLNQYKDTCLFTQYNQLKYLMLFSKKSDTLKILSENHTIIAFETFQKFDTSIFRLKALDSLVISMDTTINLMMEESISSHPTLKKLTINTYFYYLTLNEINRIINILEISKKIKTLTLPNASLFEVNSYYKLIKYCELNKIKLNLKNYISLKELDYVEKMRALRKKEDNKYKFFRKIFPNSGFFIKLK